MLGRAAGSGSHNAVQMISPVMNRRFFIHVAIVLAGEMAACGGPAVGSIGAVLGRNTDSGAVHVRQVPKGLTGERAVVTRGHGPGSGP